MESKRGLHKRIAEKIRSGGLRARLGMPKAPKSPEKGPDAPRFPPTPVPGADEGDEGAVRPKPAPVVLGDSVAARARRLYKERAKGQGGD